MRKVVNETVDQEINELPARLADEWKVLCRFYFSESAEEVFHKFKEAWHLDSEDVKEIIRMPPLVHKEWLYWRNFRHQFRVGTVGTLEEIEKAWKGFKKDWQYGSKGANTVFHEMSHLSADLIKEWRHKYSLNYRYCSDVDYGKSKAELWDEFKEIWDLNVDDYDEHLFYSKKEEIEKGLVNFDSWYEYRTDNNYHSFDSYPVLEQHQIWTDFLKRAPFYKS